MAKQAYVYSGTDWVPLASEVTNLSGYQTKALNQFANRNLIINGDMQIAQRGTSVASITTADYRTADRFRFIPSSMGTWTMSQENDAPTGSGFAKSLKLLCTTADASPAAGDYVRLEQRIEGQNLQQIKKGTSAAEQLTISFWVKTNKTGTYIVEVNDDTNNRSVSKSYTVNASGTWEKETITFPADTTGTIANDNAMGLRVIFWQGVGTSYSSGTLGTTWATLTDANRAVGQVNLADAISNYWQVTGVQLEVGDVATPFEFKSIEEDLLECQRYYFRFPAGDAYQHFGVSYTNSGTAFQGLITAPVTMRAIPTSLDTGGTLSHFQFSNGTDFTLSSLALVGSQLGTNVIRISGALSGATGGSPGWIRANNSTSAYIGFSAEL
jgi:hypothetical protein